ncbi:hypothetical protein FRC07_009276 [Ceratobasidium sp. 392]|nr:hypothetical protein FRC07_009276 [Ceratobasidium sp. 392]
MFYTKRFEHLRNPVDLDLGIECMARATLYDPNPPHDQHYCQIYSGMAHLSRFDLSGKLDDLRVATDRFNTVSSNTAFGSTNSPVHLGGLAMCLYGRFKSMHELGDLDNSIECLNQGLSLLSNNHSLRHYFLHLIAVTCHERFTHVGGMDDLDRAIDCLRQAVSDSPDQHTFLPKALNFLGNACLVRFDLNKNVQDLNLASASYFRSSQISGSFWGSFLAAIRLADLASKYIQTPEAIISSASLVMEHIPKYVWLGSPRDRRYVLASSVTNTTGSAILSAIRLQRYDSALAWFEQSRLIVWNSAIELRTPLDELRILDPALAGRLQSVNQEVESVISFQSQSLSVTLLLPKAEDTAQRLRRLVEEREQLISEARSLPNMSTFLATKTIQSITLSPEFGAIVALHIHKEDSHALVVRPNSDCVECVSLGSHVLGDLVMAQGRMTQSLRSQDRTNRAVIYMPNMDASMGDSLKMLWTNIVKPVLDCLGYEKTDLMENRPHITWCTSGPLASLPLHAAGDYDVPDCSLFDYAISSFTTNLAALDGPPVSPLPTSGILAVGLAYTPGLQPLPGTTVELNGIGTQAGKVPFARLEGENATVPAVLEAIEKHGWVHFACHASQDPTKPTNSAFHLHDGPLALATVADKRLKNADLAFLSACQTATGDVKMPEEAVHLAAGMIMSGYRRVIATMWSIDDRDAPLVAEKFYSYMLDDEMPNNRKAGRALHYAVGCLRDKIGVKEFARWAPYIHIGQ